MGGAGAIESALYGVVCSALDERLRPVLERLDALEARLAKLEPGDEGLTYKQAALALGVSTKTIGRWVDAKKITAGGGTTRSPRILRSEVHRVLQGSSRTSTPSSSAARAPEDLDMTALARQLLSSGAKSRKRV